MRRALRFVLPAAAAVGILLLFVLPMRTYLNQQHSLSSTERRASDLAVENAKLQAEARQLQSTTRIEQIAREEYGLVMPGQQAYAIIPSGTTTTVPGAGTAAHSTTQRTTAHGATSAPSGRSSKTGGTSVSSAGH